MAESFERQLAAFLLSVPELTEVIDNRLYPLVLDYGKPFPAATYRLLNPQDEQRNHQGAGSLRWGRLQLDLWDRSYLVLTDLAAAVDEVLDGNQFIFGHTPDYRTVSFFHLGSYESNEPKSGLLQRSLDYRLEYQR